MPVSRLSKRWAAVAVASALAFGSVLVAPTAATAAGPQPAPDGVYINTPWVEPGGRFVLWFVGTTPQCGTEGSGYDKDAVFVSGATTTPLQQAGAGGGYFMGYDFAFVDEEFNPLPLGESGPVTGTVQLTCTPVGGGAAQTLSFPLTVRTTPPPTIYHSPTAWTWFPDSTGAVATVSALGFKPGEPVEISLVNGTLVEANAGSYTGAVGATVSVADGAGAVTASVILPSAWDDTDLIDLVIAGATSRYLLISGEGSPIEGDPSLAIDSSHYAFPGGAVAISAGGYESGETVQLALHSPSSPPVPVGTITANASGVATGYAYLPTSVVPAAYRLWAGAKTNGYLLLNAPLEVTAAPATDRISGADRFATAVAISAENFAPGVDTVYLANGLNFPDALSAGALAAQQGAPVLLTVPTSLPDTVADELERLKPSRVVIVGGTPSVSSAVKTAVEALDFPHDTDRIAGADRFETNRLLIADALDSADVVYVSTGLKFPDALAAAPAAAYDDGAVLLVNGGASSLDAATLDLLDDLAVGQVYIVGDSASVSAGIASQLGGLFPGHVERYAGADRYATAAQIVGATWPTGAPEVILASGANFPDALAASALGQPMLTSTPTCIPPVVLAQLGQLTASTVTLVGDASALSAGVKNFTHC